MTQRLPLGRPHPVARLPNRRRHRADRLLRRDDHDGQDEQRQRRGSSQDAATQRQRPHEHRQPQHPVDDRRHAGQVRDVGLDHPGQPTTRRVFLQIDRRAHAQREREEAGERHHPDRPVQRRLDPRTRREARRIAVQKLQRKACGTLPEDVDQQHGQKDYAQQGRHETGPEEYLAHQLAPLQLRLELHRARRATLSRCHHS